MKIDSSAIELASSHASTERHTVRETLRFWTGSRPDFEGAAQGRSESSSIVSLTNQAKAAQPNNEVQNSQHASDEENNDPKIMLILRMLEMITGKKIKLLNISDLQASDPSANIPSQMGQGIQPAPPQPNFGLEYDRSATQYEAEQTNFSAQGVISTADGKEIRFGLQLTMQREFQSQDNVSIRAGNAIRKDPLVINFSGTAAQLTDTKFAFDIDADGKQDKISFAGPGSGFLALDLNMNGKIDNGAELFGTKSGNGFADLAKYDSDGNHWIDQNDAVFDKLRVWAKDASGQDSLTSLTEHGVGALYLGSIATPFSAKNSSNALQGQVRASGVYLNDNGSAGTLQQVDLTA